MTNYHVKLLEKGVDLEPGETISQPNSIECMNCDKKIKSLLRPLFYTIDGIKYLVGWHTDAETCKGRYYEK